VTLLKGLYPDIVDNDETLKSYIYLTFWYELYSTVRLTDRIKMQSSIFTREDSIEADSPMTTLAEKIGLNEISRVDVRKILYRVKNMSLPSLDYLGEDVDGEDEAFHQVAQRHSTS
jgi:hypothetical protein